MNDLDEIRRLYVQYGFETEECAGDYAVFSLPGNIYPGVDIVASDSVLAENLRKKYSENNYSTNVVRSISSKNVDLDLYRRFLRPQVAKKNLLGKYKSYVDKVLEQYKDRNGASQEYSYIKVDYKWEKDFKPYHQKGRLIEELARIIESEGPKLIIVEAAAGFGKTSTSYELLKYLCGKDDDNRPFLMELERDRQASTFHYLLLSQIDRSFEVALKNNIVVDNIRKGRIPLIIDGFDELLSRDLDSGRATINVKKVETMLSTIADLLVDNTKVILTSRKTAIFSGEEFGEWVEYQRQQGKEFSIDRFQLLESLPENWLSRDMLKKLPDTLGKISNPVLLSFLRYSNFLEETENFTGSDLIKKFFSSLYARERKRQELPLKASEQDEIFRNLAVYFSQLDITADVRSSIKDVLYELKPAIINDNVATEEEREELLNKLVNHAMLDRHENGLVGFINDFIYGSFLSKAVARHEGSALGDLIEITDADAQKIIEASIALDDDERICVAESLTELKGFSKETQFKIEYSLLNEIRDEFSNLYLEDQKFVKLLIGTGCTIRDTQFIRCVFDDCALDLSQFEGCMFISCDFSKSIVSNIHDDCAFYGCNGIELADSSAEIAETGKDGYGLDREILGQFLRSDNETTRIRRISRILSELQGTYERKMVLKQIDRLANQRRIYVDGDNAWILQGGTDYLKSISSNG